MKDERWMVLASNDLDLPPSYSPSQRVSRERLECRFLRGKPCGEMLCRERPRQRVLELVRREQPAESTLAFRVEQLVDPRDVDQVDAEAGDHDRAESAAVASC